MGRTTVCVVVVLLVLCATLPVWKVEAIHWPKYWIAVTLASPVQASSPWLSLGTHYRYVHSPLGKNWSISFLANWGYGKKAGQPLVDGTISVDVKNENGTLVDNLLLKTNEEGVISFNYASSVIVGLTFTPVKAVTGDGVEYNPIFLEELPQIVLYGFGSENLVIYWDSFDISINWVDTSHIGNTRVEVYVSYPAIPSEWIGGPESVPITKWVGKAEVKINGVNATDLNAGRYVANVFTWLPTVDLTIEVTKDEWPVVTKSYSCGHIANQNAWIVGVAVLVICVTLLTAYMMMLRRKKARAPPLDKWMRVRAQIESDDMFRPTVKSVSEKYGVTFDC